MLQKISHKFLLAALAVVFVISAFPGRVLGALQPKDVVVIVNSNVPHSVALGRFYCHKRGVPAENIIALPLPTGAEMSAEQYLEQLARPLKAALDQKNLTGSVRCLLTFYGVPYRMTAKALPPQYARLVKWFGERLVVCTQAVRRDIQLMEKVGENIPENATLEAPLNRLDLLFSDIPEITDESLDGKGLNAAFANAARKRMEFIRGMDDSRKQQLAIRQVMALYVDCYGLDAWTILASLLGDMAPPIPGNIDRQQEQLESLKNEYINNRDLDDNNREELADIILSLGGQAGLFKFIVDTNSQIMGRNTDGRSAIDSELALLLWKGYAIENAMPNPLHWRKLPELSLVERQQGRVLMTSRLDGPSIEAVMKMIVSSIEAEKNGLKGKLYIDYGSGDNPKYDRMFDYFTKTIEDSTEIDLVKNNNVLMFKPGQCTDVAIYSGWYNPGVYIDAFDFNPGAVAYHIGVNEAMELRKNDSTEWVPSLIKDGVAATIGGVYNSGIFSYPPAIEFIPLLYTGKLSICESYWRCLPQISWRMMLIADPLYNPFKMNPQYYPLTDGIYVQ